MQIPLSQAKGQLLELVRRAEAGEDIELTRRGQPVARLIATPRSGLTPQEKRRLLHEVVDSARGQATPGPGAARSQDYLYDENGLPV